MRWLTLLARGAHPDLPLAPLTITQDASWVPVTSFSPLPQRHCRHTHSYLFLYISPCPVGFSLCLNGSHFSSHRPKHSSFNRIPQSFPLCHLPSTCCLLLMFAKETVMFPCHLKAFYLFLPFQEDCTLPKSRNVWFSMWSIKPWSFLFLSEIMFH